MEAWLKCKYMREHLGEEFGGVVTAATGFGIFVTLDAMYVEGLVHITELGGEYFRFDEARQELRGERTGIRYAIGTRVRVQVSRVDLDGRKIDFRLVTEGESLVGRAMKDKAGGHAGELPDSERDAGRYGGGKRSAKGNAGGTGQVLGKRLEGHSVGRSESPLTGGAAGSTAGASRRNPASQRSARSPIQSPIQALKAAVKKAAGNPGRKQGKKPRR